MLEDTRIKMKNQHFLDTFEGKPLYYIVEEVDGEYELRFVTSHLEDYEKFVDGTKNEQHIYHLFKSYIFGIHVEWVESYNGYTDECDVSLDFDEKSLALLAQISLEKNITVNEVIIKLLQEYIEKKDSYVEDTKE